MDDDTINIDSLSKESLVLYKSIEKYQKENDALRKEVAHLKELLTFTAPLIGNDIKIEVPKEQAACEIQLQMLHKKSYERELTLEETKRLEILIKSLYLIKDKATGLNVTGADDISIADLTKMAEDGNPPSS